MARSDLPAPSKLVLHTLGFCMDMDGMNCQVGQTRLSVFTGLCVSTVKSHLSSLESQGWVRVERSISASGDPDANRYHPAIPTGLGVGQEMTGVGQQLTGGRAADDRGVGQEMAPTSIETSKKTSYVYPAEFETVWAIHHRGAKKAAFAEWKKASISQDVLLAALKAYSRTLTGEFKGQHLHRWIRDERWEEVRAERPAGNGTGRLARV